ncbi:MAG: FHA domain-containing protein [Anaerolineae bacterium]|nr:FHA domain-containing protein [Anaerolineae bacterium]MDW8173073.1 FHA domain-containing protein [Anaerolineae bacterium]
MASLVNRPNQLEDDPQDESQSVRGQRPSGDPAEDRPYAGDQKPLTFSFHFSSGTNRVDEAVDEDEVRKTGALSPRRRHNQSAEDSATTASINHNTSSLGEAREMILLIRGMVERLVIDESIEYILGRFEAGVRNPGEIDLTPYGAMDRGVSRHHLRIHFRDGRLYVTDLASTNGTFIGRTRLEPNNPVVLRKGDELMLGRLPIQILFR